MPKCCRHTYDNGQCSTCGRQTSRGLQRAEHALEALTFQFVCLKCGSEDIKVKQEGGLVFVCAECGNIELTETTWQEESMNNINPLIAQIIEPIRPKDRCTVCGSANRGNQNHVLTRKYGGENITGWIQPTCSCGWEGRKEYAYEDYQHTNVKEQESDHIRSVSSKDRSTL